MSKILFMYPNITFLDFIKSFLGRHGFEVEVAANGSGIYNTAAKLLPELIIIGKNLPELELRSFLFKKKVSHGIKSTPIYLVGDFSAKELVDLKDFEIAAFISSPINPFALLERINAQFKITHYLHERKTPMLTDIHVKGRIFVIQIEANLELDKLDIINFKIRSYCMKNKIKDPRLFYIVPSIYPESLTDENLSVMFYPVHYPEFRIRERQIKILTKSDNFINAIKKTSGLQ